MDFSTTTRVDCTAFVLRPLYSNRRARITWMTFILFSFFSFQSLAQSGWTLLKSESGVEVYYQIDFCEEVSIDPAEMLENQQRVERLKLKLVNTNPDVKSVTYAKVIKTDDSDEFETIELGSGTLLIDTCEASPEVTLTRESGDNYPESVSDFLEEFSLTINQ